MPDRMAAIALIAAAATSVALFLLPLLGLFASAPWAETAELLGEARVRQALLLSLGVSTGAVLVSLLLGFPLAWILARREFPGRRALRILITLPMVMPPVVAGVALLAAFSSRGLLGPALSGLGVTIPFTTLAAVIAAAFVSAPFLITTLEAGISQVDERLEDVARTLGASRWLAFRTVLLPAIRPSLLAGIALCWARALGEFGATITFAGNLEGHTQTVPLAIYQILQTHPERAFLLGSVLLLASLLVLVGLRGRLAG
jgi:molybdate transport system permease protein